MIGTASRTRARAPLASSAEILLWRASRSRSTGRLAPVSFGKPSEAIQLGTRLGACDLVASFRHQHFRFAEQAPGVARTRRKCHGSVHVGSVPPAAPIARCASRI